VSHELRTPMTSVKTSLSLLLGGAGGPVAESARELLEIAHRNADRLIRLVNDLLDLSRLEAGRLDLRLESVPLEQAIRSSVEAVAGFALEQKVTLDVLPPPAPVVVLGMRDRVEQVVVNLLANAVKFSPAGGRVAVRWWRDGDDAVTEVVDHGPGIPREHLEAIFQPFRQIDSSTTREHGGAGLGLAISQGIVEALDGKVWAESELGAGSTFFIRLPLAPDGLRAPEAAAPAMTPAQPTVALVAHSDPDWRRLAALRAEQDGWRVVAAATGAEALAVLERVPVDVAVLALELSDMHGFDLLQQLQANPKLFELPVVLAAEVDTPAAEDGTIVAGTAHDALDQARRLLAAPPRPVVLLIEDDPILRPALGKALRRAGYACLAVPHARRGLELARARTPRVIITDYRMPEMDGLTFLREIRNDPSLKGVSVMMMTGHMTPELARQAADLSARLFSKPLNFKALLAHVRELT
jgi:CheY-like chemotaxis protein